MSISIQQNEPDQIDLLVAQRYLYSLAKKYFTGRSVAALALAIIGPVVAVVHPNAAGYVGLFSLAYLVIDFTVLESLENKSKESAAKVQELFDTRVLSMPWNDAVVGARPQTEVISQALANRKSIDRSQLIDWYAPEAGNVPEAFGRILCQRTNLAWDTNLRRRYAILMISVLGGVTFIALVIALKYQVTLNTLFGGLIFPLIPFIEIYIRQIIGHFRTADGTRELIERIEQPINQLMAGENVGGLDSFSRTFQDELYRHRKSCPLVFDWVYWRMRNSQEKDMYFSIASKVKEFSQSHFGS